MGEKHFNCPLQQLVFESRHPDGAPFLPVSLGDEHPLDQRCAIQTALGPTDESPDANIESLSVVGTRLAVNTNRAVFASSPECFGKISPTNRKRTKSDTNIDTGLRRCVLAKIESVYAFRWRNRLFV